MLDSYPLLTFPFQLQRSFPSEVPAQPAWSAPPMTPTRSAAAGLAACAPVKVDITSPVIHVRQVRS